MKRNKSSYVRDLRRQTNVRVPKQSILIVCEGDKTEPNYFKGLAQHLGILGRNSFEVEIDIRPSNTASAPKSVVEKAKLAKDERERSPSLITRPYDQVYCVIDTEIPQHKSLKEAIETARQCDIEISLSNPCFEYWLLLHYEMSSKAYSSTAQVLKDLRNHCPGYKKCKVDQQWFGKIDQAVRNSKAVLKIYGANVDLKTCTGTEVHKVVELMREMTAKKSGK
ncbi:MAG: hypothetical protein A2Y07_09640 [Planctomycetes bacterium GWF2_50_10]|nr:MAG: hypothetical protein A2Y07_09640 [Planctomycetes bacterium GWF2_50_10]